MRSALDVHRRLLAEDVPHEIVRLRSRLTSSEDLPALLDLDVGCVSVLCYVVEREEDPVVAAALVPAGAVPSPTRLLEVLDACAVRPATPAEVNTATDYAAGLVSPVCLPEDVHLVADASLAEVATSYCALGEGGVALAIRTADLLRTTGARVATLVVPPAPEGRVVVLDPAPAVHPSDEGVGDGARAGGAVPATDVL